MSADINWVMVEVPGAPRVTDAVSGSFAALTMKLLERCWWRVVAALMMTIHALLVVQSGYLEFSVLNPPPGVMFLNCSFLNSTR